MTERKITFTVKSINKGHNGISSRIIPFNFTDDGSSIEIVRINFTIHDEGQRSKLDVLENQGTYELSFDDKVMEVNKGGPRKWKGGNNLNMCSAAGPDEPEPEKHYVMVNEGSKEMEVSVFPQFTLNITKQGEQPDQTEDQDNQNNGPNKQPGDTNGKDTDKDKKALIEKNIKEIRAKLEAAGINQKQEIEILGNVWENTYRHQHDKSVEEIEGFKEERIKAIDEFKKDTSDNQPPKNPKPTPEQINNAKDKLKNAENSDNKEDLINALNETKDTTKNSSDEDLKKQKEKIEDKLGQVSNEDLVKHIREEVKNILEENGVNPEDLSPEVKTKYDELNNNNNNNNAKEIRTEIQNEVGTKSLENLITAVEQAIKAKDKKQIDAKIKELQEFANSQIDYKKSAYEKHKDEVQRLLAEGKNYSSQGDNKDGFFRLNNPIMWVSGVALIGLVAGVILIIRAKKRKHE